MKNIALLLVILSLFARSPSAHAEDVGTPGNQSPEISWLNFDLGAAAAYQSSFSTYSAILRWNPAYEINSHWSVGLDAGFTVFKYINQTTTPVIEYAAFGKYTCENWALKIYAGAQTWTNDSQTAFMAGPEVSYALASAPLFIKGVYVSYTPLFQSGTTVHEVGAGLNLGFGN